MILSKQQVLTVLQEHRDNLTESGVRRLGLFGSYVRNEQTEESDIDVLVEFEEGKKTYDNFMRLCLFLEDKLQRRVEVVTLESLSPYIRPHVVAEVEYVLFPS